MTLLPNAKINLGLNIVCKRPDGYHDLETVMYPIPLCDELTIEESSELSFKIEGIKLEDDGRENLVVRAYRIVAERYNIPPIRIHLLKNIPSGAGLGGGSADAAFMIRGLNDMFHLSMSTYDMERMAAKLGADCAFFINNVPAMCKGIGDIMTPANISLKGYQLLLVKPDVHISTAEAYRGCTPKAWSTPLADIIKRPISEWNDTMKNDFEPQVFALHGDLQSLKQHIYDSGALYSSMSGSGSAFYGIFNKDTVISSFSEYNHYVLGIEN